MALRGLETAQSLTAYLQKQLLELEDCSSEKAKEAKKELKKELKEAKKELKEAKTELKEAKKELKEAEQKYEAKASVQAGRVQARASACAVVVAVAFGLQHSRVCFRAVHRFCFLGSCSPLGKDSLVVKLPVLACSTSGSGRGLLAGSGFMQIWLPFVFCRCFRTGSQS